MNKKGEITNETKVNWNEESNWNESIERKRITVFLQKSEQNGLSCINNISTVNASARKTN